MPQLDQFTYFTQFFWFCLFLFTFYILIKVYLPDDWEVQVYLFFITKPKLRKILSFFQWALFYYFLVRVGFTLYHFLTLSQFFDLSLFPVLPTTSHSSGGSNSIVGVGSHEGSSSGWTSFDLNILAEEEDEVARPRPLPQLDPGTEDHIYRAVDAIITSCENEEALIVEKARALLLKKGAPHLTDEDKEDIRRAINMALYDAWETDIDRRLEQFRRIRRFLGTGRSEGAEIARTECGKYGKTSRNVFNQKIDYASAEVSTRYGISGRCSRGCEPDGTKLGFGRYGTQSCRAGRLSYRAIEAARRAIIGHFHRAMSGQFRKNGKIWVRVFADIPITGKPTEVRMGRGKGNPTGWIARVSTGQVLFEMDGVNFANARQAATLAAHKPCSSTKFVKWS
ncbi:hypothetical protein S245_023372 [Arachis hypogaea]